MVSVCTIRLPDLPDRGPMKGKCLSDRSFLLDTVVVVDPSTIMVERSDIQGRVWEVVTF